jgi:hypothetical protein
VTPLTSGVRLAWDPTLGASDYAVDVTRASDGAIVAQVDSVEADTTIALEPNTSYTVSVLPLGFVGGSSSVATAGFTTGGGTALVVTGTATPRSGDYALGNELALLGYSLVYKASAALVAGDATGKAVVVVSASAIPAEVGTKLTTVSVPVVTLEAFTLGALKLTGTVSGTDFGVIGNQTTLVVDGNAPITGGSPRTTLLSTAPGTFGWGVPGAAAIAAARIPGAVPATGTAPRAVFGYEKGAALVGGGTAAARRVAFLADQESLYGITPDGHDTFAAAIRWAVDPAAGDPVTPTGLTVTPGASSVVVKWNAVSGASAYYVLRETLSDQSTRRTVFAEALARVTGTSYTDAAPVAGVPYAYRVVAVNTSGSSAPSGALYAAVSAPPQRPQIAAVALAASARIDIQPVGGATSLRVLKAAASGGPYTTVVSNLAPTTSSYTVTGLANDTLAYFVVESVNATGFTRSLEAYAIPHAAFPAPAGLAATVSASRVALTWSAVANARGYRVGRAALGGSTATDIVTPYTTLATVTDVNVPNGKAFTYFVTALGDAETAGPAATIAATAKGSALLVHAATATAGDVVLRDRLTALGFDIVEKSDTALVSGDATGKNVVVVTESVTSGNVNTKLTAVATPVVSLEPSILDDLKMTGTANGTDYGTTGGQTQVNIVDGTHPLAAGLSGVRTANTTAGTYLWGVPSSNAVVVGTLTSSSTRATVFGYQVGFPMASGVAPARRVGLFIDSPTATSFTADGAALYDAAVRWAAGLR